jgi:hypothetical protein
MVVPLLREGALKHADGPPEVADETPWSGGRHPAEGRAERYDERGVVRTTTSGARGGLRSRPDRDGTARDGRGTQQARAPTWNGASTGMVVIGFIGLTLLSSFGVRAPYSRP